ncbi:MAG TPA: hypothetical protein VGE21_16400 [Flavobacteriales bacterium]
MSLTTAHSLWLAPLCLLLGLAYAWFLYRGGGTAQERSPGLRRLLAICRTLVVALLAFFLLEPLVRVLVREVRRPVIVLAHDGSSSLLAAGDTAALRGRYAKALQGLAEQLGNAYEVRAFTYSDGLAEGLSFAQGGARTDIDQVFRVVQDRFAGPDLGAVIIDGDGIYNRGRDPLMAAEKLGVPVFTIALGDTTVRSDLLVRDVEHNRITYLGNAFPVRVRVQAHHLRGKATRVSILREGREVAGADVTVNADPFLTEVPLLVKAEAPGVQRYTVSVRTMPGEAVVANNQRGFTIEVLDDRRKVLLLAEAPHPDIAAIRAALDALEGYSTEVAYAQGYSGKVEDHDLVVLHQLPSSRVDGKALLQRIAARGIPTWTVLGLRSALNELEGAAVEVRDPQRTSIEAQGIVPPDLALFTLDAEDVRSYERFPPLQVPYGSYALARGAVSLMDQRVGMVPTKYPLMAVTTHGEQRHAITCGEGLWRWRLADRRMNGTTAHFDKLVQRITQYLSVERDKERFRVTHAPTFAQGDPVLIDAELYNVSYEPVNTPEATLRLTDAEGRELAYAFSRLGTGYRLDAGTLPAGRYTWKAETTLDGERLTAPGDLVVDPLVVEQLSTVADHGLWSELAARTEGLSVPADSLDRLAATIAERRSIVPRSYAHAGFSDLIGLRWIFFLLLGLLTLEWTLRRRSGSY